MGKNFPYSCDGGVGVGADLGFWFRGLRYKEEVSKVTELTVFGARRGAGGAFHFIYQEILDISVGMLMEHTFSGRSTGKFPGISGILKR